MAKKRLHARNGKTQVLFLCFVAAAFFLISCLNADTVAKYLVMGLLPLFLIFAVSRFGFFKEHLSLPVVFLLCVTLMGCVSALYAIWGDYALRGAVCLVVALCAPGLVLLVFSKDHDPARKLATVLAAAAALMAIVSIDLISTNLLAAPVLALLRACSEHYSSLDPVEAGVRINGLIGMPNVFAGCCGIGVLLSLGLAHSAKSRGKRRGQLCCLYLSALAFVLTFSMGAIAAIALGFAAMLLLERKGERISLFLLMVKTLVTVLLAVIPISMTSLGEMGFQPLPLLCAAAGAALLCLADRYFLPHLAPALQARKKLFSLCAAGLCILAAGTLAAALLWVGPARLAPNETLRRAVYPTSGQYRLQAQAEGDVFVTAKSQNKQETMMRTSTTLYSGSLADAAFDLPEDSLILWLEFSTENGCSLEQVSLQGSGGQYHVPLDYKLLPGFIANRLQGLRANENAIQRTVFFRDGLKVFAQSPIIGQGLGAFEMAYSEVQDFYYETKYVHNHYIQTLLETGIVGLGLFLGLLISSAAGLLRARKKKEFSPLLPALGGLLLFLSVHAGVEVVFSVGFYLPLAFGVFWLIGLCCKAPAFSLRVRKGVFLAAGGCLLAFSILLGCNLYAKNLTEKNSSYSAYEKAVTLDAFDWATYANSYLRSATGAEVPVNVQENAAKYALRLEKLPNRWVHYRLTHYYLEQGQPEKAMASAMRHAQYNASNSDKWNELFALLAQYASDSPAFDAGLADLTAFLQTWDEEHIGSIVLNDTSQAFLADIQK